MGVASFIVMRNSLTRESDATCGLPKPPVSDIDLLVRLPLSNGANDLDHAIAAEVIAQEKANAQAPSRANRGVSIRRPGALARNLCRLARVPVLLMVGLTRLTFAA